MPSNKRLVKYMHLLEGRPAQYVVYRGEPGICFSGGRQAVPLVDSLRSIRRQQRWAIEQARKDGPNQAHWVNPKLYSYARVYVD